ncbi:hypothetical protein [Streptomyces sp. NPDC093111]|uniref:hypothetical protein n=1 Tax=Streptomyces sp. NPDC093111 TaxID=3154978 RepID=UPI003439D86D
MSFERLADVVDAASRIRYGKHWTGPDPRLRCDTTAPVYEWPDTAPYNGGPTYTWDIRGYGSHASEDDQVQPHDLTTALCGFRWAEGDKPRRISGLPDCTECRREVQLGGERPRSTR